MVGFTRVQEQGQPLLRQLRDATHFRVLRAREGLAESRRDGSLSQLPAANTRVLAVTLVAAAVVTIAVMMPRWQAGADQRARAAAGAVTLPGATAGNDTLVGMDGDDLVRAGGGADMVLGGAGADNIHGGTGNDTIAGGSGNDTLYADAGRDVLFGGAGNDQLHASALDQGDRLVCGPGNDVAHVSRINGVVADATIGCERIVITDYTVRHRSR